LVLCAILFRPDTATADAGTPTPSLDARIKEGAPTKDDPPSDAAPIDEETRRYCEAQRAACESHPRTRVGCIPEPRCRVWDAARRAPPAGS
jgi:hypothetical protein